VEKLDFEERPWGAWHALDRGESYQVKRLVVLPGRRLSYQTHRRRAEHWVVVAGTATCTIDGESVEVKAGGCVEIGVGVPHRIANRHDDELVIIEVQCGDYFGEDDICRLEDDYGRQ
jgi:mannose-6-phosphate isomerase-like protein (cupin superfamily)